MTVTIAVAGKGGTGKTTLAGLLIRYLIQHRPGKKVLAIDADPSSNLHLVLGLPLTQTVGAIREELAAPRSETRVQIRYHDTGHGLDLGIEWIAKSAAGKTVWIAVNADSNPVEATIGGPSRGIEVLAGRRPEWTGSALRAKFDPFGVSIWRYKP
jgi:Cdc6-like AAA superfamily ATPase